MARKLSYAGIFNPRIILDTTKQQTRMASRDNKSHYAQPRRRARLLILASVISDDNNVEALVHGPQQREQIRHRAVMCSVMWLLRLLTIYRLAHLSASGTHTGECFIKN